MACTYMREAALLYTFTTSEINYAKDPLKYFNLLNKRYCILGSLLQTLSPLFHLVNSENFGKFFRSLILNGGLCQSAGKEKRGRCVEIR